MGVRTSTYPFVLSGPPVWTDWGLRGTVTLGTLTQLCLLQVLERWCTSPRTIEVLMNTYSVVQLPEEAMRLVPPETMQVRFQDTTTQPAPRESRLLKGSPVNCPTLPHRNDPETLSWPRRKLTERTPKHTPYA